MRKEKELATLTRVRRTVDNLLLGFLSLVGVAGFAATVVLPPLLGGSIGWIGSSMFLLFYGYVFRIARPALPRVLRWSGPLCTLAGIAVMGVGLVALVGPDLPALGVGAGFFAGLLFVASAVNVWVNWRAERLLDDPRAHPPQEQTP